MLEMKEAVADAQRKASSAEADARKERLRLENERLRVAAVRSRCKRAAKEAASARKLAKSVQLEKTDIEVKAARERVTRRRSSGLAQARISKALAYADAVRHRKRRAQTSMIKRRAYGKPASGMFGYFHGLPHTEQVALVEMCRAERNAQRRLDQEDLKELNNLRGLTRKTNSELELEALIKNFALALSFYDRYKQRARHSFVRRHCTSFGELAQHTSKTRLASRADRNARCGVRVD